MGDSAQTIVNKHKFLDGKGLQKVWEKTKHHYAEADGESPVKNISCPGFTLYEGAIINLLFPGGNSASKVQFNINNTGARKVYMDASNQLGPDMVEANYFYTFIYTGSSFQLISGGPDNTIYIE